MIVQTFILAGIILPGRNSLDIFKCITVSLLQTYYPGNTSTFSSTRGILPNKYSTTTNKQRAFVPGDIKELN